MIFHINQRIYGYLCKRNWENRKTYWYLTWWCKQPEIRKEIASLYKQTLRMSDLVNLPTFVDLPKRHHVDDLPRSARFEFTTNSYSMAKKEE